MSTEIDITPEVQAHIEAVSRPRVEKNTEAKYYRIFWGAYKQHVHELLVGVGVGSGVGALAGLGAALLFFPVFAPAAIIVGAAGGLAYAAEKISSIGTSSGAHASSLAEKHARALAPENKGNDLLAANDQLMNNGGGHHYDFMETEERQNYFHLKSGLTGTLIGAASGGLLGSVTVFAATALHIGVDAIPIIGQLLGATAIAGALGAAAPIIIGAIAFGILGLTFGIDRGLFKSLFNKIDSVLNGRSHNKSDPGREQAQEMGLSEEELMKRRMQRQEDIHALQDAYDKNIFMGGLKGFVKGLVGGIILGAFIGTLIGVATLGVLAVVAAPMVAAAAPLVMGAAITGFAGYFGTVFSETGYNAGTEATTRAIDDELARSQAKGAASEPRTAVQNEQHGIIGRVFDGALAGVRKLSEASKDLYNQAHDFSAKTEPAVAAPVVQEYSSEVTYADMRELDRKMNREDATSKNVSDIIKERTPNYQDFATMLANQKTDYSSLQNKN